MPSVSLSCTITAAANAGFGASLSAHLFGSITGHSDLSIVDVRPPAHLTSTISVALLGSATLRTALPVILDPLWVAVEFDVFSVAANAVVTLRLCNQGALTFQD